MWFIGVEVEQGTSAPPPKKNPRSAPVTNQISSWNDVSRWRNFKTRALQRLANLLLEAFKQACLLKNKNDQRKQKLSV